MIAEYGSAVAAEVPAPKLPVRRTPAPDDLVVHAVMLTGDEHRVAGKINDELSEFIGDILSVHFTGLRAVVLIRATRARIEAARREKRL